jgi:hypothetical protein
MDSDNGDDWGVQVGGPPIEEILDNRHNNPNAEKKEVDKNNTICLGTRINFPLKLLYQVLFISGKRGSGKSYTAAVLMEEYERLGLQFVCFDALDAHGHLNQLIGVERIEPKPGESVNMRKLVEKLKRSNKSLIINLSMIPLEAQQIMISDYCEALLETDIGGRGLMTMFEEVQDFVPQMGRPSSFASIVRLCKLGRASGYGVALISQRPAAVNKEALSQASIYVVHNIINTKDLDALKEQLSFGTDKDSIKKILQGITYSSPGEAVVYSPEFFKDEGYIVVGKIDTPRRTEHKGSNIEVKSKFSNEGMENHYNSNENFSPNDYGLNVEITDFSSSNSFTSPTTMGGGRDVVDVFKYEPENYLSDYSSKEAEIDSFASVIPERIIDVKENLGQKRIKLITAIGLISGGIYTVLRSVAKRS